MDKMKGYWFMAKEGDDVIVLSFLRSLGIEAKELTPRRSRRFGSSCGPGFGDNVWRVNIPMVRIEVSFSKPCANSRILKQCGFKWDHQRGVWYSEDTDANATLLNSLGIRQIEHVVNSKN